MAKHELPTTHTERKSPRGLRTHARRAALQALYQWQMTGQDTDIVAVTFLEQWDFPVLNKDYFRELVREIPRSVPQLDDHLTPVVDRPLRQIDPVERAILWIGTYELEFRSDVPWRVVVNEAVELAKSFGAEQSHKYVNGILDKVAKKIRASNPALRD
uniref:Transcription antitermination protein NusB n=1 Tax=Candidatus Kentrum eta TaxID=2126337 RepID=A0A450V993_9GAMM|nr:MAG: NusB antitermination factor [Candidatus Kentron sp. H]VFK01422.1 MAG: NusB antitermination factor [Candidatus Kentron sp. H]VFK04983.1 MAG: NusB antitermination factor [Candidatus Kentron sp. H]